jgi:DNA polymerase
MGQRLREYSLFRRGVYPCHVLEKDPGGLRIYSVYPPYAFPLFVPFFEPEGAVQGRVMIESLSVASLMVIGEGPGAEEDRRGLPFVGKAGQLLDKMLAAIGRSRAENAFITNVNYWRPPGNRNPETDELAVCRPFVDRMIELTAPKLIIAAGGVPAVSLLASKDGIMKLRGNEYAYATPAGFQVPIIPVLHPAYLLRRPQDKSRAWRDLMLIEKRLAELGG